LGHCAILVTQAKKGGLIFLREISSPIGKFLFLGFFETYLNFSRVHEGGESRYRIEEDLLMRRRRSQDGVALRQDKMESKPTNFPFFSSVLKISRELAKSKYANQTIQGYVLSRNPANQKNPCGRLRHHIMDAFGISRRVN
jgi:hypothetical protein